MKGSCSYKENGSSDKANVKCNIKANIKDNISVNDNNINMKEL